MPARRNRRRTTRPRRRQTFETRVSGVLNNLAEKKIAKLYHLAVPITPDITKPFQLMPNISQGVRAHAMRIGNDIKMTKMTIKGFIRIPPQLVGDTEILSRMMIIKQRDVNASLIIHSDTGLDPLFDSDNLMEYQQPYNGLPASYLQSVNADKFIVRRDIKKHYSVSANVQGSETEPPLHDSIKFFNITLTFGKGKKLTYGTDTDTITTDFPYFLVCAIHQPDGSEIEGAGVLDYYTEVHYTDI